MFFFKFLIILVPCLLSVAFFTLLERKVLGLIGIRLGPYKVSAGGFLQPIGDAGKLMNKEINNLSGFSFFFYYSSSFFMFFSSLLLIFYLALDPISIQFKFTLLLLFIVLGFNSLNSILSGWSVYSKFSLLGSLRTVSQLISYEILLYLCFLFLLLVYFSFDVSRFLILSLDFFFLTLPALFFVWMLSVLAELNRTPYDFSEGESELVSGFNVEFGSSCFTFIFLAEYGNIFFFMVLSSFFFFSDLYCVYFSILLFIFVLWIRSVLPRYRFDKLMGLSWSVLVPFLGFFVLLFFCSCI